MGKQGPPRSPRPEPLIEYHHINRCSEAVPGSDVMLGRRLSGGDGHWGKQSFVHDGVKHNEHGVVKQFYYSAAACKTGNKEAWVRKPARTIAYMVVLMVLFFLLDSLMVSIFHSLRLPKRSISNESKEGTDGISHTSPIRMYDRLLDLASHSLAEQNGYKEPSKLWEEQSCQASTWGPCADRASATNEGLPEGNNGYIVVSANGGLNQQRVAICNAVAVASLLNATLVVPKFLISNVWNDPSQFGDIYQEEYFIDTMKKDTSIVKRLPPHLQGLNLEEIGSQFTDSDITKEAQPIEYLEKVLPVLLRNGIVHFLGFGHRLGFDSLSFKLQRLRCKCNFHALKFTPKIQSTASLIIKRMRKNEAPHNMLVRQLIGNFLSNDPEKGSEHTTEEPSRYLALHLRFEIDMVAYSLCEFGGGEKEKTDLEAYRKEHFALFMERLKKVKPISQDELRKLGRCPLTPEEAALLLAAIGYKRETSIYIAGSQMYGGSSRMHPLYSLYPNLVTKEDILTPAELAPFKNYSSQLAALDFISCAAADVFAMTDTGSQLASQVSGYRIYYGGGNAPTLRPNKKRFAAILSENQTIIWQSFEERIRKMIAEGQRAQQRGSGRSIYRQPRCPECMCKSH